MELDIIGDVHGHADRLEALLRALGYTHARGAWRHPSRTAIFVGDLIDRGPGQLRTLELVRDMVEAGTARVTMGNHEFNAIAWATRDPEHPDHHLRPRHGEKGEKNRRQHRAFLEEVGQDSAEHRSWIDWFRAMPLWIEMPGLRVVHACWSPRHVDELRPHLGADGRLSDDLLVAASRRGSPLYEAMETVLKGAEVTLPAGGTPSRTRTGTCVTPSVRGGGTAASQPSGRPISGRRAPSFPTFPFPGWISCRSRTVRH